MRKEKLLRALPKQLAGRIIRSRVKIDPNAVKGFTFKIAQTRDELEAAYNLAYDAYLAKGFIDPNNSLMHFERYHALPSNPTFIATYDGKVVMTMSLFVDSPLGLPMDELYQKELNVLRQQGRLVAEVCTLASDPNFRRGDLQLPLFMNKIMHSYAAKHLGIDDLLITVNPTHELIYKHIILFERIGPNKAYDKVNGHVAVPLRLNLQTCEAAYKKVYSKQTKAKNLHHFYFEQENEELLFPSQNRVIQIFDKEKFIYFYQQRTNKVQLFSKKELTFLNSCYATTRPISSPIPAKQAPSI